MYKYTHIHTRTHIYTYIHTLTSLIARKTVINPRREVLTVVKLAIMDFWAAVRSYDYDYQRFGERTAFIFKVEMTLRLKVIRSS